MKCSRCGAALRMEKVSTPVYEEKPRLGIADKLRYQADSNGIDAVEESEATEELMREAADLFDQIEKKTDQDCSNLAGWLRANVFNQTERVQTGSVESEEPSDCPRCQGSY